MAEKSPNEMTAEELVSKCIKLLDDEKYNDVINELDLETLRKHNNPELYNSIARANHQLNDYDKAIAFYKTAIELLDNPVYHFNLGISLWKNNDLESAINAYTKAIKLRPDYAFAYNNRGVVWRKLNKFKEAMNDYTKAISINSDYSFAYNNRGFIYEINGKYEKAIDDYEKAITLSPENHIAENNLTQLLDTTSSTLRLFTEILKDANVDILTKSKIHKIFSTSKKDAIDKIRTLAGKNINNLLGKCVVHYTRLSVADTIATMKSKNLRYYNAIYMNDPEEGQVILDCLDKDVRTAFENANQQEEGNIYIGSFLPAEQHEDELVMWRTYGKDENQVEGAGCSISITKDFFDDYADDNYINPKFVSRDPAVSNIRQNLFRVLYYNKNYEQNSTKMFDCAESKKIQQYIEVLNQQLLELVNLKVKEVKKEEDIEKNKAIDKIIYHLISEIRFFFKSSDYSFENEVRVLQYADKSSGLLKIDERNVLPKKVYIESNKEIQPFIERITLGPKVPNPKQWLYLDIAMRQNNPERGTPVEFIISQRKYQ